MLLNTLSARVRYMFGIFRDLGYVIYKTTELITILVKEEKNQPPKMKKLKLMICDTLFSKIRINIIVLSL